MAECLLVEVTARERGLERLAGMGARGERERGPHMGERILGGPLLWWAEGQRGGGEHD